MADTQNLKEIYINGKRLMEEKDYGTAIKNFEYYTSKSEENDFVAFYYLSECYHGMEDYQSAVQNLSAIIKSYNLGDKSIEPILYMKALYKHAKIDII